MSPDTIRVWNDGKSAETSHENFPDVIGETLDSINWLSLDDDCCRKKTKKQLVEASENFSKFQN